MYSKISVEAVKKNKKAWAITLGVDTAKQMSKEWGHKIFRLPNGAYVVRMPTGKRMTPKLRAQLERAGQFNWN
jgi:hypothetical protein